MLTDHAEGNRCKPAAGVHVILSWLSGRQCASAENASCRTPARLAQAHACRLGMPCMLQPLTALLSPSWN